MKGQFSRLLRVHHTRRGGSEKSQVMVNLVKISPAGVRGKRLAVETVLVVIQNYQEKGFASGSKLKVP